GVMSARSSGGGCVVDAAMVDGAAYLGSTPFALLGEGWWRTERESNLLDGGAPYYRTYETADGEHMAVGAIEPQFYAALLDGLGLAEAGLPQQNSVPDWPEIAARFAAVFASRTRQEWSEVFAGTDACVAPVLSMSEAPTHPHNIARATFVEHAGFQYPAPTPRFASVGGEGTPPVEPSGTTDELLGGLGYTADRIAALRAAGTVA